MCFSTDLWQAFGDMMGKTKLYGYYLIIISTIAFAGLRTAVAQGNGKSANRFINPPAANSALNPVWVLGQQQVIIWTTTLTTFNISIWQQNLVETSAVQGSIIFSTTEPIDSFTWIVQTYDFDLSRSPIFFFWVNANQPGGFTSNYFNISSKAVPTTTSIAGSSSPATTFATTSLPSTVFTSGSQTIVTVTATETGLTSESSSKSTSPANIPSTQNRISNTGLTSTAKTALGAGVGVGVALIAALGIFLSLRRRRTRRKPSIAFPSAYQLQIAPPRGSNPISSDNSLRLPDKSATAKWEIPASVPTQLYPELPDHPY